jgi:hypothetical protein
LTHQPRRGVRQYDLERQREESANPPKKVLKLSTQSINFVSIVICCKKNCV